MHRPIASFVRAYALSCELTFRGAVLCCAILWECLTRCCCCCACFDPAQANHAMAHAVCVDDSKQQQECCVCWLESMYKLWDHGHLADQGLLRAMALAPTYKFRIWSFWCQSGVHQSTENSKLHHWWDYASDSCAKRYERHTQ